MAACNVSYLSEWTVPVPEPYAEVETGTGHLAWSERKIGQEQGAGAENP